MVPLCLTPCLAGCSKQGFIRERTSVELSVSCGDGASKGHLDSEDDIWDCNIYVFDAEGAAFSHSFHSFPQACKGLATVKTPLFLGEEYSVYAIANAGYDTGNMSLQQLLEHKLYISYPDGNLRGIAMAGREEIRIDRSGQGAQIGLQRLMARIDLNVDISRLDAGITFQPTSARIGNCARCTKPFKEYGVESRDEIFPGGYTADMTGTGYDYGSGTCGAALYCMENIQGGKDTGLCPYVEVFVNYRSAKCHSEGKGLVYRFYLHEGEEYGVRRNCRYNVSIRPEKDGLSTTDSWRLDKGNLVFSDE